MRALIHIYCGDGKGKTSAAVGLALRAAGAGKRVLFTQFLKDGSSSEIPVLKAVPGIDVRVVTEPFGFVWTMDDEEFSRAKAAFSGLLREAEGLCLGQQCLPGEEAPPEGGYGLLVLDEIIPAVNCGIVPEQELLELLVRRPDDLEIVLTGRDPSPALRELADYLTEMKKIRHPYDQGLEARKGIEY